MKPPLTMWQSPQLSYIHTGAWCQYRMYTSSQRHHWPAFALKTSKIIQQSHRILSEKGRRPNRLAGKGRKVWYIRQLVPVFRMHPNFLHQLCYASYALFQSCSCLFSHSKSFHIPDCPLSLFPFHGDLFWASPHWPTKNRSVPRIWCLLRLPQRPGERCNVVKIRGVGLSNGVLKRRGSLLTVTWP